MEPALDRALGDPGDLTKFFHGQAFNFVHAQEHAIFVIQVTHRVQHARDTIFTVQRFDDRVIVRRQLIGVEYRVICENTAMIREIDQKIDESE